MGRRKPVRAMNTVGKSNHSLGKSGWKSLFEKWSRTLELEILEVEKFCAVTVFLVTEEEGG